MDVRMPDGTVITGVPEGITQTELLARYNKYSTPAPAAAPAQPPQPEAGLASIAPKPVEAPAELPLPEAGPVKQPFTPEQQKEASFLEELKKGATGAFEYGLPSMYQQTKLQGSADAFIAKQKSLDLMNKIDSGEFKNLNELKNDPTYLGLVESGQNVSQLNAYMANKGQPEVAAKLRGKVQKDFNEMGASADTSIDLLNKYTRENQEKYGPRVQNFTDINWTDPQVAADFANWMGHSMGSAGVQLAPIVLAGVITKQPGVFTLGSAMETAGAVQNRMEAIGKKTKDMSPAEQKQEIKKYLAETGDANLIIGAASGSFDMLLGPAAHAARTSAKELMKAGAIKKAIGELPKDMLEEAGTGALQEATQIAGKKILEEAPKQITGQDVKDIVNSAMAEAMGAPAGTAVNVGRAAVLAPSEKKPEIEEEKREPYVKQDINEAEALARSKGFLTPQAPKTTQELVKETVPTSESQDYEAMLAELEAQMEGKPAPAKVEEPVAEKPAVAEPEPVVKESLTTEEPVKEEPKKDFYQRVDDEVAKIDSADTLVNEFARMRDRESPLTASSQVDPIAVRDALINRLVDKDPVLAAQIAADIDAGLEKYSEQSGIPVLKLSSFASSIKKRAEQQGAQKAAPVVEEANKEEPTVSKELQDAKDALSKAGQRMNTARRMRRDSEITEEQFKSLQDQFDARKKVYDDLMEKEVGSKSPFYKEAMEIGNRMIATGDVRAAGFGQGIIARARLGQIDEESMSFYRERAKEYEQRSPEFAGKTTITEKRGLPEFVATGNKQEIARYEYLKDHPEHKDVLAKASDALQAVADEANRAGFKVDDINPTSPQNIQEIKRKASRLAGAASRYMMEAERVAKGHKTADQAKLDKSRAGLEADIQSALKPTEKAAAPVAKEKPKTGLDKVAHWRRQSWDKNPLMAFLANHGLYHEKGKPGSLMSEFNAGQQIMISGYGPVFKSSGLQVDALLPLAIQDGFLPQDANEDDLERLIEKAVSGKKVEALYQEQGVEDVAAKYEEGMAKQEAGYEERAEQTDAEWYGMTEQEYADMMAAELEKVSDEDFDAIDEAIHDLGQTPASNISERAAMELLGFTEEEIQNEERRTAAKAGEAATREKTAGAQPSEAAPTLELEAQTAEDLKAKQNEIDRLNKENDRLKKEADAKAKADAEREEFVLTGSDRAADVAAAQGQKDIFGAMEEESPAADAALTKLQKITESLLDSPRTKETVDEVEYEGKTYESRTRSYEGRLFGSELQLLRDTVGNANSITLVNEPERVLTLQLTGKQVGQGRDMRITETVYTPKGEATSGELVTFTHRTDTEPGKGQVSGYYPGTYSYETGADVAIPAKGGKNEFVGELKESDIYTLKDADQLKREASNAGFEYRQASGNSEIRYLQSLGYKAMRRGPEIIVFNAKDANFKKPEVASEVVPAAEKPAAPQLTREPVTIEGETRLVAEKVQHSIVKDQLKKLHASQVKALETFYGFKSDTTEFLDAVRQDVIDYVNKGAKYINGKIRTIIRSMANGVLSVAVVFNPQFVSQPYTIAVPQYTTKVEQVLAAVPEAAQKDMSEGAKRAYAVIYPAIKGEITKNDKFFIVADKKTANTFVFNPDGSLFMYSKTLFSAGIGDFLRGDNNIVANRITPAGLFDLGLRDAKRSADEAATAGEYDFGKVFVLDKSQMGANGPYSTTIMHSVWTHEKDAKQRLAALQKPGAEDSRYSFGCINVDKNTYGQLVTNNLAQMDGAKIFIVPENATDVMSFVNGEATYSKDIIRQRVEPVTKETKVETERAAPKAETERTIAAKEEEGPVFNSIEAETAGWSPSRIDQLINEFGYTDGRTFGMAGYVNPADFVKATTPTLEAAEMLNEEAGELNVDAIRAQRQTPFLFWDIDKGAIIDHEGRHRMAALARAGVTRAPVVLVVKDRYGNKKPDHYTPEYGTFLSGQGFQGGKGQGLSVKDLVPLSYEYKEKLGQDFGKEGFLYSLERPMMTISVAEEEKKRSPSFKRKVAKLNRDHQNGKISAERMINEVDWALKQAENDRLSKEPAKKERGYLEIVRRLAEATKRGDISKESFDLATWFMRNNEALVDDLGVAIRGKGKEGVGGQYETIRRIMFLVKGSGSNLTVVHEILHHLERMMPVKVQQAIRKAWSNQLLSSVQKAKTPAEQLYFKLLIDGHYGQNNFDFVDVPEGEMSKVFMKAFAELDFNHPGSKSSFELAETLLKMGEVSISNYEYFNPSEFWAVNGSDIVKGRFDAVQGGMLARLKNWLKELAQKIKGMVGMNSDASIIKALDSLSKADGTFVTKDMLGEGEYKNVRRNYEGNEAPAASWESPEESKMDNFIYKLQDKLIDTKRVIENIKKASGEIADNWNAYLKEELYHGRTAKRTQDFLNREMLPILEEMKEKGVTLAEFEQYLHMRHAEERNELVAKRNPKMPDQGSGVTTAEAVKYLAELTPEQSKTFASLAKKFDKIIDNTQKLLVSSGLETQDTIDAWNQAYEHYVPLMRDDLDFKHHGTGLGAGYSTKGSTSKSAVGSTKKVIDIFANVALQRERAIVRSEKARVGRALYGLAIKNPNPGFWLPINPEAIKNKEKLTQELIDLGMNPEDAENIIQEPKVPAIDKKTGLVKYQVNPLMRNSDNVFPVRINGEDRYIFFNTSDERAVRMVEALKNLDAEQLGVALGTVAEVTRWIASVNTQFNPVFGAWNFIRDVQGAAFNLTTTDIAGHEKEVLNNVFPAMRGIYTDLRQNRKKSVGESEWAKLFEQYQDAGGQTGYRDQFNKAKQKANIVEREMSKLNHGNVRKTAEAVFNWLSDYNDAMENAVRLSAFKVALDQGLSEERAASIAKNLTVNFNRKGAASPTLQALYAFFNAAVQGTARLAETLSGPSGRKIMAGGFAIGVFQALALAMAGYDDDDPPEFLKNKNLILPIPGGNYLIVPMPLGFNVFPGAGRLVTEYVLGQAGAITGAKSAFDKVVSLSSLVLDAFNPLGSGSVLQMVAPTVIDPWVSIATNRDAFGRPISKEDRATAPTPGYTRSRENASAFSKALAEFLNYISSPIGTKYTKGVISPTADQIDYLIGQYTGGTGREVMKAAEFVGAVAKGETGELPSYRIPIVGKLYGETESPAAISAKFYENVTKLAEHENEIKMRQKNKDDVQEYKAEHPEVRFIHRVNNLENQITALNKQKKALQEKEAPEERIKRIDERKTKLMKDFNDKVKNLERQ